MSYFRSIAEISLKQLSKLPAPTEPQPIAYVEGELLQCIEDVLPAFVEDIAALPKTNMTNAERPKGPVGLNTVGLLCDRLTILLIKAWVLKVKRRDIQGLTILMDNQVAEMIGALDSAARGYSSVNTKLSNLPVTAEARSFAEAYAHLQFVNLQLWESQEVLYLRDIKTLPCEELRAYIGFFAQGNLSRNKLIELVDGLYWGEHSHGRR